MVDYDPTSKPQAASEAEPDDLEVIGLSILVEPGLDTSRMSKRNQRRLIKDKQKWLLLRGMGLSEFVTLSITDQFLHLRKVVPDGWKPVDIQDAKMKRGES